MSGRIQRMVAAILALTAAAMLVCAALPGAGNPR